MAGASAIEWTDATWNPVTGCTKVSPGCAHCYAETISLRFGRSQHPWTAEHEAENVVLHPQRLDQPLRWKRPRMVFVNSMSDLFHEQIPDDYIHSVFQVMERAEQHTFQVLTKRPSGPATFSAGSTRARGATGTAARFVMTTTRRAGRRSRCGTSGSACRSRTPGTRGAPTSSARSRRPCASSARSRSSAA